MDRTDREKCKVLSTRKTYINKLKAIGLNNKDVLRLRTEEIKDLYYIIEQAIRNAHRG